MSNPVYTTIKNNTPDGRTLRWNSKAPIWLPGNGEAEVPYEPWSLADRNQRAVMLASLRNGTVSLTLHLVQKDGTVVDIPYDPSANMPAPAAVTGHITAPQPPKPLTPEVVKQDDNDHIVRVGSENVMAAGLGLKVEDVKPPSLEHNLPANGQGFASTNVAADRGVVVQDEMKKVAEAKEQAAEETPAEEAPADEAEDTVRDEFNKLVSEKQWEAALKLMISTYGQDKVTFSVRSIMAMKDYDAIVAKYNLK